VKKRLNCEAVWQGQEYKKPFTNVPFLVGAVVRLVKPVLPPSFVFDINGDSPYFINRLMASRTLSVTRADSTPPLSMDLISPTENTALLGGEFADGKLNGDQRRALFGDAERAKNYHLEPDLVYTWEFFQHMFFPIDYTFRCALGTYDVYNYLNNQPVQILARLSSGEILWNILIDHEKFHANDEEKETD
jgi:hypothetical protein